MFMLYLLDTNIYVFKDRCIKECISNEPLRESIALHFKKFSYYLGLMYEKILIILTLKIFP